MTVSAFANALRAFISEILVHGCSCNQIKDSDAVRNTVGMDAWVKTQGWVEHLVPTPSKLGHTDIQENTDLI